MKFFDLFDDLTSLEDLINEGKYFADDKFLKFVENAGWWLYEILQDTPGKVGTMPGYSEYIKYVINKSKQYGEDFRLTPENIVYSLPDYYGDFINVYLPAKTSNKLMAETITKFGLKDYMEGRDPNTPRRRGRKPKVQSSEPQAEPIQEPAVEPTPDQEVEPKKRGRKPLPPEMRKPKKKYNYYTPKGTPRGRPKKVVEPTDAELTGEPEVSAPIVKEPKLTSSQKIKNLEDKIAALEKLLRDKGVIEEQRVMVEAQLKMLKDYQKFL